MMPTDEVFVALYAAALQAERTTLMAYGYSEVLERAPEIAWRAKMLAEAAYAEYMNDYGEYYQPTRAIETNPHYRDWKPKA